MIVIKSNWVEKDERIIRIGHAVITIAQYWKSPDMVKKNSTGRNGYIFQTVSLSSSQPSGSSDIHWNGLATTLPYAK